jgi:glycosyltransferase involved in cell wall biosynthesis
MKIVMLTESLASGGAERQMCTLAGEFKRRGHQVCVATCRRDDFCLPLLEREGIAHRLTGGHGKLSWVISVRRFLRTFGQDVVLAFLPGPSAYAELASLPKRTWGLVVSERSSGVVNRSWVKMRFHMLADGVITNSHSARVALCSRHPGLKPKLVTIYNAVRAETRTPVQLSRDAVPDVRLIVAARIDRNKNPQGLLAALHAMRTADPSLRLSVDWYGSQEVEPEVVCATREAISRQGLGSVFRLHQPTNRIRDLMVRADAVVLPSFREGLPNAVCEGMALGKPILMSDVCDARNLVEDGVNGFLFDPHSPKSIADAIARFAGLAAAERTRMGRASRAKAEVLFDVDIVVDHYLRVLKATAERELLKIAHWPPEPPTSACAPPRGGMSVVDRSRTSEMQCV